MARKLYGAALAAHERKLARKGGGGRRRRASSKALVRHVHHHPAVRSSGRLARRRRRSSSAGLNLASAKVLIPVTVLAAAYGYSSQNIDGFADMMKKIPGVKTLGAPLVIGGVALGINRYVYANKWLRAVAAVGLTLAAYRWGTTEFAIPEWTGDVGDMTADVQ